MAIGEAILACLTQGFQCVKTTLISINDKLRESRDKGAELVELTRKVPAGYTEDFKSFTVSTVSTAGVAKQLTELEGDNSGAGNTSYIIKEIRFYFPTTPAEEAYFHLSKSATTDSTGDRFGEGYYNDGSFIIFNGDDNGRLRGAIKGIKPSVWVCAGATYAGAAMTVYGDVHYYFK